MTTLAAVAALIRRAVWYEARAEHPGCIGLYKAAQARHEAERLLAGVQGARFAPYAPWPAVQLQLGLDDAS